MVNTADKCKDITYSGGTTNLWRHFSYYHRALHDRLKALESPVCKQINLNNYIHSSSKQCHCIQNNHDHKDYERKLALYIIGNNCALSTIDSERFRAILPKSYQPPTRKTFYTNAILPLASEVDVILNKTLTEAVAGGVSVDGWQASSYYPYIHVSYQFINNKYELVIAHLGLVPASNPHTANNILDLVEGENGLLGQYNLKGNFNTYVTDNASNCKAAFEREEGFGWFPCIAHTINLVVKKGMEDPQFQATLKKVKAVVKYFHMSSEARRVLKEYQEYFDLQYLNVTTDADHRWNSTYLMFKRLLELRVTIEPMLMEVKKDSFTLNSATWEILKVCQFS